MPKIVPIYKGYNKCCWTRENEVNSKEDLKKQEILTLQRILEETVLGA